MSFLLILYLICNLSSYCVLRTVLSLPVVFSKVSVSTTPHFPLVLMGVNAPTGHKLLKPGEISNLCCCEHRLCFDSANVSGLRKPYSLLLSQLSFPFLMLCIRAPYAIIFPDRHVHTYLLSKFFLFFPLLVPLSLFSYTFPRLPFFPLFFIFFSSKTSCDTQGCTGTLWESNYISIKRRCTANCVW